MTDEPTLTLKETVRRAMVAERGDRRWRAVLQEKESGRHVATKHLLRLMRKHGVPAFAGQYAAARFSGEVSPNGRPCQPPLDHGDLDTLWYHFTGGAERPPNQAPPRGVFGLFPTQFHVLAAVRRRHRRYKDLSMSEKPQRPFRNSHKGLPGEPKLPDRRPRFRYVPSRGTWRVSSPKEEARRVVAKQWGRSPATLEEWERNIRQWSKESARVRSSNPP